MDYKELGRKGAVVALFSAGAAFLCHKIPERWDYLETVGDCVENQTQQIGGDIPHKPEDFEPFTCKDDQGQDVAKVYLKRYSVSPNKIDDGLTACFELSARSVKESNRSDVIKECRDFAFDEAPLEYVHNTPEVEPTYIYQ